MRAANGADPVAMHPARLDQAEHDAAAQGGRLQPAQGGIQGRTDRAAGHRQQRRKNGARVHGVGQVRGWGEPLQGGDRRVVPDRVGQRHGLDPVVPDFQAADWTCVTPGADAGIAQIADAVVLYLHPDDRLGAADQYSDPTVAGPGTLDAIRGDLDIGRGAIHQAAEVATGADDHRCFESQR